MELFKPNIEQLEKNRNAKKLITALEYKAEIDVRKKAARALGNLKDKSAISALENALLREADRMVIQAIAGALSNIGYLPQQNEVGARYAALVNDYDFCVNCGTTFAVPNMFSAFIALRNEDGHFYKNWRRAYLQLGSEGFRHLTPFSEQIYSEYKQFISDIKGINHAFEADKQKAAVIKHYSHKLCQLAETIAQYKDATALAYLTEVYRRVRQEVYSHPTSKFHDIFNAIDIRESIIGSISAFGVEEHGEKMIGLLCNALSPEEYFLVRLKVVEVLERWPVEIVRQSPLLVEALRNVLVNEPQEFSATASNRKQRIHRILGAI